MIFSFIQKRNINERRTPTLTHAHNPQLIYAGQGNNFPKRIYAIRQLNKEKIDLEHN